VLLLTACVAKPGKVLNLLFKLNYGEGLKRWGKGIGVGNQTVANV